jgi:hypothetical protein
MGILSTLFGTDEAVDNITNPDNGLLTQLGTGVGNLHYSEQEKANMRVTIMHTGLARLKALEPFKVVQRILAFMATFLWVFVGINCVAAKWYDILHPAYETVVDGVTTKYAASDAFAGMFQLANSDYVFWPVVTVYGLYFSGGVIESIKNVFGKKDK